MADQAVVYYSAQLGKESVHGTAVPTTFRPGSFGLERMRGQGNSTMYRPQGSKLNTVVVPPGRRWVEVPFTGTMTFNEMIYILDSAIATETPTSDGTNGKKWVYTLQKSDAETKTSFTLEQGSSIHAQRAAYLQCSAFTFEMSPTMSNLTGSFIGYSIEDDVALTATPAEIALAVIPPQNYAVYLASTWAGLVGAGEFGRPMKVTFSVDNIVAPLMRMQLADTSYVNLIEQAPNITMQLTTDADDAGMAYLDDLTAGNTVFVRVKALGDAITGAIPSQETFILDFAGAVSKDYDPTEDAGAALAQWTLNGIYDPTSGKAFETTLINTVAAVL